MILIVVITYNTKLLGDTDELKKLLQMEQLVYNIASKEQFPDGDTMTILHDFAVWLAHSPINAAVTAHNWFVPEIQIVHIVAIAAVVIAEVLINFRALGLLEADRSQRAVFQAWYRVILIAVAVLAATGFLLIASEPGRALFRTVFWVKLGLIVLTLAVTGAQGRARPTAARVLAVTSLLLWAAVIVAGRWIAYAEGWPGAFS